MKLTDGFKQHAASDLSPRFLAYSRAFLRQMAYLSLPWYQRVWFKVGKRLGLVNNDWLLRRRGAR